MVAVEAALDHRLRETMGTAMGDDITMDTTPGTLTSTCGSTATGSSVASSARVRAVTPAASSAVEPRRARRRRGRSPSPSTCSRPASRCTSAATDRSGDEGRLCEDETLRPAARQPLDDGGVRDMRTRPLVLVIVLAVAIAGCGTSDNGGQVSVGGPKTAAAKTVAAAAVATEQVDSGTFKETYTSHSDRAGSQNVSLSMAGSFDRPAKQSDTITTGSVPAADDSSGSFAGPSEEIRDGDTLYMKLSAGDPYLATGRSRGSVRSCRTVSGRRRSSSSARSGRWAPTRSPSSSG